MQRFRCLSRKGYLRVVLYAGLLLLIGWSALSASAAGDPPAIVRLSYVTGSVRILSGDQVEFEQAVVNMPLLEGYRVETGNDGQAELEFEDGSVARLTPNSSLQLNRLYRANGGAPGSDLEQRSGLAYYELNITEGQRFAVRFAGATARPTNNSIVRINLDHVPELAVLQGTVHVNGGAGSVDVPPDQSIRLDGEDAEQYGFTDGVRPDSWDQWNADRDREDAALAQNQTEARDSSGDSGGPGWDDLDAYGNWYPVEGYGNVWAPEGVAAGWDPYGYGYWANYPTLGYTWISGYPWGWLPYHCGAWNYFNSFGWGWIPGQCGLGWAPLPSIWNVPPGYHPPPRPIPGGHIGGPSGHLVAVDRGPGAHGPLGNRGWRGVHPLHTTPVQLDGHRVAPLPRMPNPRVPSSGLGFSHGGVQVPRNVGHFGTGHVGVPVRSGTAPPRAGGLGNPQGPGMERPPAGTRPAAPVFVHPSSEAPRPMPAPQPVQPRMTMPPPRMSAPPAPHISAPAPTPAPHGR